MKSDEAIRNPLRFIGIFIHRWPRFLVGLLLISALIYRFDAGAILSTVKSAKLVYIALAAVVYSITFLILSTRWRMILRSMREELTVFQAYQAFAGGMILSDLTPGRIGDLSRPLLVRDKIDLTRGITSVALDRYSDILTTFILGLSGLLIISQRGSHLLLASSIILILAAVPSVFWLNRELILRQSERKGWSRLNSIASSLERSLCEVTEIKKLLFKSILITMIAWLTHALRIVLIAKSVGYDVPFHMLFLLQPLVTALAIIPVTISGLGVVEGGFAALLAGLGIPAAIGICIALLDRIITVTLHLIFGWRYAIRIL